MANILPAPWTPEQVERLNHYQQECKFHPFTCGNADCRHVLRATVDGWVCDGCAANGGEYRQHWCHAFMAGES